MINPALVASEYPLCAIAALVLGFLLVPASLQNYELVKFLLLQFALLCVEYFPGFSCSNPPAIA